MDACRECFLLLCLLLQFGLFLAVKQLIIYDFNNNSNVSEWTEHSDTIGKQGMSKATLVLQEGKLFRRAVFFSLLNPQVSGAGFAGIRSEANLDLQQYGSLAMRVRGQGKNKKYKFILRHKGESETPQPAYVYLFEAPFDDYNVIKMPLRDFKPYFKERLANGSDPLNARQVTGIGIQVYGGVNLRRKQSGVSCLEIDWIIALG